MSWSGEHDADGRFIFRADNIVPTSISNEAFSRLKYWGIDDEIIKQLRLHTGVFAGRYAGCPAKVAAIRKVYYNYNGGDPDFPRAEVTVPHFFDAMGRLRGGQCGDLSALLLANLEISGISDTLRRKGLYVARVYGKSPTHFNKLGSYHLWCGIFRSERLQQAESTIVIDPSFQVITLTGNGYTVDQRNYPITDTGNIIRHPAAVVPVSDFNVIKGTLIEPYGKSPHSLILGISADGQLAYGLGFGEKYGTIFPFTEALCVDGSTRVIEYCDPQTEKIVRLASGDYFLNGNQQQEMGLILRAAQKISLTGSAVGQDPSVICWSGPVPACYRSGVRLS